MNGVSIAAKAALGAGSGASIGAAAGAATSAITNDRDVKLADIKTGAVLGAVGGGLGQAAGDAIDAGKAAIASARFESLSVAEKGLATHIREMTNSAGPSGAAQGVGISASVIVSNVIANSPGTVDAIRSQSSATSQCNADSATQC